MKIKLKFVIFISLFIIYRYVSSNSCQTRMKCDDCIRDSSKCVWCSMEKFNGSRCISETKYKHDWCLNNTINPESSGDVREDVDFSSNLGAVVQIKPQKIEIKLRPRVPYNFEFYFKPAKDYPVDMYFLMDGSTSMIEIKTQTLSETKNVYYAMRNMTRDVYLGMGSFVDKNALPYTHVKNSNLTYSFRNKLKLTNSLEDFYKTLSDTEFGENYDSAEGTFDALSQVLVCKDEIGWRNESTKIVIVLTDANSHSAGDGMWAGINRPYDGKCYTESGVYTKELEMDYPSVSMINKLATDEEIIILFAVPSDFLNDYKVFEKIIRGSKAVKYGEGKKDDGEGMVAILKKLYQNIVQNIKLKANMQTEYRDNFKISFAPNCLPDKNLKECAVQQDKKKKIIGTVELLNYIEADNVTINIMFEGLKEQLKLIIKPIEKCDCNTQHDSETCNGAGDLACGLCECNPHRYGDYCECDIKNSTSLANTTSNCISPSSTSDIECSGHGQCRCGQCICGEKYKGTYCECHENSCNSHNNLVCAGNGDCYCRVCNCYPGFIGSACECPTSTEACTVDGSICNNRGACICGNCQCEDPSGWDVRGQDTLCKAYCLDLPTCLRRQCQILEPIALRYSEEGYNEYDKDINITEINNIDLVSYENATWHRCPKMRTTVGCYKEFIYKYKENDYGLEIIIQSEANCAENYIVFGCSFLVAIIVGGLIALITWKLVVKRRDRLEYERFMAEVAGAASFQNPVYNSPTSNFDNPTFRKLSFRKLSFKR